MENFTYLRFKQMIIDSYTEAGYRLNDPLLNKHLDLLRLHFNQKHFTFSNIGEYRVLLFEKLQIAADSWYASIQMRGMNK